MAKNFNKIINKSNIMKFLFIAISILFIIPSVIYITKNKTILGFGSSFEFLLTDNYSRMFQMIIFLILFILVTILYFLIIKNNKKIFKNIKQILIFVTIVTTIFAMMLPFTSTDVFYYIGVGWLNSHYHQNPYYISMNEFLQENQNSHNLHENKIINDEILIQGSADWGNQRVVYGPVWTLICALLANMSFGSVNLALVIFKISAVIIHIINIYLIYKISRKKVLALIYGLNPFILIEAIANVHNDIYVIFFTLLSMYFLLRKKNLTISVIFLAIATCIKYVTILLLPFIILYYYRKEKRLIIKFEKCILYGVIFLLVICCIYVIYIQDLNVLKGISDQQGKYTKSIQTILQIYNFKYLDKLAKGLIVGFTFICIILYINTLTRKNLTINYALKQYNTLLYIFVPLIITSFQPWYIMWFFPTMIYQNGKTIKRIIGISIVSQIANCTFLLHSENYLYTTHFITIMIIGIIAVWIMTSNFINKNF